MADFEWKSMGDGVIQARRVAGGVLVVMQADTVRKERTGLHAKITLALAEVGAKSARPITSDSFNTDKEAYRHDFVNAVYGVKGHRAALFPPELIEAYPRVEFARDLYDFCEEFYAEMVGKEKGGWVTGDSEKSLPDAIIEDLLLREGGTILFAAPGSGKSNTALLMAQSINAGICTYFKVEQAVPLYVNLERGAKSMSRRLGLVNRALGLPAEHPLLMLNARGKTLKDVYDIVKGMIAEHGVNVVFLDSISRAGVGDMNTNDKSNDSMDMLNALCPSWLAVGHTSRAESTHVYGSIMFDAAMDIGINLLMERKQDGTLGIGLKVTKANDTGFPPLRILAYEFDKYGLTKVREASSHEFPEIEESDDSPRTNEERIKDQFLAFGRLSKSGIARDLNMNKGTVSSIVDSLYESGWLISLGKEGREFFYGAASKVEGQR